MAHHLRIVLFLLLLIRLGETFALREAVGTLLVVCSVALTMPRGPSEEESPPAVHVRPDRELRPLKVE